MSDIFRDIGTRTHQVHVASQHVDEIRQLIKAGLPQRSSQPRNSRIVDVAVIERPGTIELGGGPWCSPTA
jgi:hypothetical protein